MSFELRTISKSYNASPVLEEISLTLAAGESIAILGRSGSGKSTLLRLLAGLEPPTRGQMFINGALASDDGRILLPPHQRGISMVFQDLALWPNLTVAGNVLLGLSGLRLSRREARVRAREALALCAIDHLGKRKLSQISGGEQQRVAMARALATRPTFLLLDEPFSGLDPVTRAQVIEEISRLARTQGTTVVLVTHEPLDAIALCGRGVVLEDGAITGDGAWTDLFRDPRSALLRVFKERVAAVPTRARE